MAIYSDITIDRGSTYTETVVVSGANGNIMNLTGYSARGKIRKSYTSSTSVDFTITIPNPTFGELVVSMTSTNTLQLKSGRYVYDIEIYRASPAEVIRVLEGQVEITPSVVQGG
jgi:hypothetical protein